MSSEPQALARLTLDSKTWDRIAVLLAESGHRYMIVGDGEIDPSGVVFLRGPDPDPHRCPKCEERGAETTYQGAKARAFVCMCGNRWSVPFEEPDE